MGSVGDDAKQTRRTPLDLEDVFTTRCKDRISFISPSLEYLKRFLFDCFSNGLCDQLAAECGVRSGGSDESDGLCLRVDLPVFLRPRKLVNDRFNYISQGSIVARDAECMVVVEILCVGGTVVLVVGEAEWVRGCDN
jgi:hypothetical protein